MAQQRRTFTADEKVAILKRHLLERIPISDVSEQADGVVEWTDTF